MKSWMEWPVCLFHGSSVTCRDILSRSRRDCTVTSPSSSEWIQPQLSSFREWCRGNYITLLHLASLAPGTCVARGQLYVLEIIVIKLPGLFLQSSQSSTRGQRFWENNWFQLLLDWVTISWPLIEQSGSQITTKLPDRRPKDYRPTYQQNKKKRFLFPSARPA